MRIRSEAVLHLRALTHSLTCTRCSCIALVLALVGCGDAAAPDPKPVIATREDVPTHMDCAGAATVVRSGADEDEDGDLAASEVSALVVVCGSSAACDVVDTSTTITVTCGSHPPVVINKSASSLTLASVSDIAPSLTCPDGGFSVTSGADDGVGPGEAGNGILDASEIDVTRTLCIPHLLTASEPVASHVDCDAAATLVHAGLDRDDDGSLALAERIATIVVCEPTAECDVVDGASSVLVTCGGHPPVTIPKAPPGLPTLIVYSAFTSTVATCDHGGFVVTSGVDDGIGAGEAGNGALDASEVDATVPLCVPGIVTSTEDVASAPGCAGAATIVRAGLDFDASTTLESGEVSTQVFVCGASAACSVVDGPTSVTVTCGSHPAVVVPKAPPGAVTLVAVADASAGVAGCMHGGFVVTSGADDGAGTGEAGNGVLDASEIEATQTKCLPASLSATQTLVTHPSCTGGAKVVTSGVDFDEDGVLDANEIGTSTLVCDASTACVVTDAPMSTTVTCGAHPAVTIPKPPTPAVTLVSVTNDPPIATCPRGGFVVKSGADDGAGPGEAGNGTLDASEVEHTTTHCSAYCGDTHIDAALGENCDDGNAISNDGCSALCVTEPSCLPPSPDVGCPPASYHVEDIFPASVPASGGVVSLVGDFPANTSIANTSLLLDRGGPGIVTLTATLASPTEIKFVVPAGGGVMTLDLDVSGADIPHWERIVSAQGSVVVVSHADVPLRYFAPVILSTSGCAGDVGLHATDCSLAGGDILRINGTGFGVLGSALSVQVGGLPCVSVVVSVPGAQIECVTPAHFGFDVPVVVTVESVASAPHSIGYFGPAITSVAREGQPPAPDIAMPDTLGTYRLTLDGHGFSPDGQAPSVELTNGIVTFPCIVVAFSFAAVTCDVTRGAGTDLHVVVTHPIGGRSRPSAARLFYPAPQIVPGTIRSSLASPGTSFLPGSLGGGESVFFDAVGLNGDASILSVLTGPTGSPFVSSCLQVALHGAGPIQTVQCTMPPGSGQYVFVLDAAGTTSLEGTDTYAYPLLPHISAITGCALSSGSSTEGCPTSGGAWIDIFGTDFSMPALVTVGGASCTSLTFLSASQLRCKLPPGVGTAAVVVASTSLVQSEPHPIGYAHPLITGISGCSDFGTTTTSCPPSGGVPITIRGTSFGATSATVFVDGALCTNVQHDAITPHEKLTCTLPPGAGANRSVWVVNGSVSDAPFHLSYAP